MRHLTTVCASVAIVAAGVGVAASAGADPSAPPTTAGEAPASPTTVPGPTATDSAAPTSTSTVTPTSTTPTSTSPTSTNPAGTSSAASATAIPAGEHQVTYTITTTSDLTANIYYVAADAPSQAAANDPKYMPMARTTVGPGSPWTLQTTLKDPTRWAFVSASGGLRVNPEFRCEITVDGQVVTSQQGGSGVQCALRTW